LFLQQSGRTKDETLKIAGWFSQHLSGASGPRDEYGLTKDQRHFTEAGWEAGQNGGFGPPAKRESRQRPRGLPSGIPSGIPPTSQW